MAFKLLEGPLTPAEGEAAVRTYHTTSLSSGLLGLKAEGFLTVTNLRLVFYGFGSALSGKSILHSEVPIADVSGITSYKGSHFSVTHLITAGVVSVVVGVVVTSIIGAIVSGILFALRNSDLILIAPLISVALAAIFIWVSTSSSLD